MGADSTREQRAGRHVPPLRVAIVGAGPRALSALDSLGRRLRSTASEDSQPVRVLIDVVDPADCPGTGAAYDPRQPPYLRLNVTASIVDVHEPDAADRVTPSFRDWAARRGDPAAVQDYPPRAVIGAYLQQAWDDVVGALPPGTEARLIRGRAVGLHRAPAAPAVPQGGDRPGAWELQIGGAPSSAASGAGSGAESSGSYDEVLLATGHAADHPAALRHRWNGPVPLVDGVYPVAKRLSAEAVAAGARVAVRGAALTFIDAALALTEGRGGAFVEEPEGRLTYRPGGREPAVVLPAARSGLLLDAKPDPGPPPSGALREIIESGRREVLGSGEVAEVLGAVERTARRILRAAEIAGTTDLADLTDLPGGAGGLDGIDDGGEAAELAEGRGARSDARRIAEAVSATLRDGVEPGPAEGRAARALRRSIAAAEGRSAGGPAWALGRAWSLLYSAIVERISFTELPEGEWDRFRTAAAVFERWAFGPPLVNARKLEALIDAGIVDPSWLDAGVQIGADGTAAASDGTPRTAPDVVIDAVLAPPGIPAQDPLLRGLVERGELSIPAGRRGCRTTAEATAVDSDGRPVPGLSVLGRPVEDVILGHDTLNRRLHSQPQQWAQRLIETTRGDR